jgi:hypothetical protein
MFSPRIRRMLSTLFIPASLVGCSLIVPSEVPTYRCVGSDPSSCPAGLVCDATSLVCVIPPSPDDGGDDVIADEDAGLDAQPDRDVFEPSTMGGDCVVDSDCASGLLCGTSTILTTTIVPANSKAVCTKPCCRSSDCEAGFVCFPGGTGGNYCVSAEKADREVPPSGGKSAGQTCTTNNNCRSGLCTGGRCVDTCCDPGQCASGTTCRVATVNAHVSWACGVANGGSAKELAATCTDNASCKNDNCVQPFSSAKRCTPPCCSSADCSALGFSGNVCAYGSAGNDQLKWCYEPNAAGKAVGATCSDKAECASRYCDAELGRCANVCCTSDDCATGETCRPSPVGTPFLRCVKNR